MGIRYIGGSFVISRPSSKKLEFEEMYILHLKTLYTMHAEYLKKAQEENNKDKILSIKGTISGIEMAVDAFNYIYELQGGKDSTSESPLNEYDPNKILVIKTNN